MATKALSAVTQTYPTLQNGDLLFVERASVPGKTTYAELLAELDDEALTWTAAQTFSGAITFSGSATFAGITIADLGTVTTADINGGTIDGVTIGGASAGAGTFTTLNATGGGALTGTWSDLGTVTTVDINGGTIDGAVIGAASRAAANVTTLSATGNVTIEKDDPGLLWRDTAGSVATHSASRWVQTEVTGTPVFACETFTDAGAFVASDYVIYKGASGATEHSFLIEGVEVLQIDSFDVTVTGRLAVTSTTTARDIVPNSGSAHDLATIITPWRNIYSQNAVTVTSDARKKKNIRDLLPKEIRVGQRLKSLIRVYQWKEEDDRKHLGVIAQEVIAAFEAENLNWQDYGIVTGSDKEGYGVNYDALLALVIGAL